MAVQDEFRRKNLRGTRAARLSSDLDMIEGEVFVEHDTGRMVAGGDSQLPIKYQPYVGYPPFDYGNLESKYPTETYSEIKVRRQANWTLFKALCNAYKIAGDNLDLLELPPGRLELYVPVDDSIAINSGHDLKLSGRGKELTDIIIYPFVTPTGTQKVFDVNAGGHIYLANAKFRKLAAQKYETYDATLKVGGNSKLVQLTGPFRSDFWESLSVGQTILYSWSVSVLGATNTIAAIDSVNNQITLTNNISASVSSDTSGLIAVHFPETVSLADYNTYGDYWNYQTNLSYLIEHLSGSTGDDVIIKIKDVDVDRFEGAIYISSRAFKLHVQGHCKISDAQVGISAFSESIAGNQMIYIDRLTLDNCGYLVVGQISSVTAMAILGSGGYIHPNIEVRADNLILTNNLAGAWRQFSGSGEKPARDGAYSYYNCIEAYNNTEYDILTSNSMPTFIKFIKGTGTLHVGGSTYVNGGSIGVIGVTQADPDADGEVHFLEFNNLVISNRCSFGWPEAVSELTTVRFINCTFHARTDNISIRTEQRIKRLELINCKYIIGDGGAGSYVLGSAATGTITLGFLRPDFFIEILIDGLETDWVYGNLFNISNIEDLLERPIHIRDSIIKTYSLYGNSSTIMISDRIIAERTKVYAQMFERRLGHVTTQCISAQNNQSEPKSVLASATYGEMSTQNARVYDDILEIDWSCNIYPVLSGNIKHIAPYIYNNANGTIRKISSANHFSGAIQIIALNGDVTIEAYDSVTNPLGNIRNGGTIESGKSAMLVCNNKDIISTGSSSTSETVGTGDGADTVFSGVLTNLLLVAGTIVLTAGAINITADANGNINDANVVGKIDPWSGKYHLTFTTAPAIATDIDIAYDYYTGWKNSGTWTLIQ